jgi:DNA-directed RNA polymerase sigma subunit (sigma70/sigma32)
MTKTKRLTPKKMVRRDTKICKLYSLKKRDGSRKHTIRSIAEIVGLSKSRVHEIIKEGSAEY